MHDDGVDLVPLHHADVEEAGIFRIHGAVHDGAVAVAVVLWRLHEAHAGVGKQRHQILEPVRLDDVIGIDGADDLRVRRGVRQREAQRAGLVAGKLIDPEEFEALAERTAMRFDRLPECRIGRVVDHHHAFEIGIVDAGDGIERLHQHLRRFAAGRDVDRHFRGVGLFLRRHQRWRVGKPPRAAAESDCGNLLQARQRYSDQRDEKDDAEAERKSGARYEVMALPEGDDGGKPGADHVGARRQQQSLRGGRPAHGQDRQ